MSADEAVRKEFEAWALAHGWPTERNPEMNNWWTGQYVSHHTQLAWEAWQASRSAAIQECVEVVKESIGYGRGELAEKLLATKEK